MAFLSVLLKNWFIRILPNWQKILKVSIRISISVTSQNNGFIAEARILRKEHSYGICRIWVDFV